jgi:hypothetical protein
VCASFGRSTWLSGNQQVRLEMAEGNEGPADVLMERHDLDLSARTNAVPDVLILHLKHVVMRFAQLLAEHL